MDRFVFLAQQLNSRFELDDHNREVVEKIVTFLTDNEERYRYFNLDPTKGIILLGPVGCGKTFLFDLLAKIRPKIGVVSTRQIVRKFMTDGWPVLNRYGFGSQRYYCFDDLGAEGPAKLFGTPCDPMVEIINDRHLLWKDTGALTFFTTNLWPDELERRYDAPGMPRVRSRLREMCNLIRFPEDSPDRRR